MLVESARKNMNKGDDQIQKLCAELVWVVAQFEVDGISIALGHRAEYLI